jgi:predicted metal-dependent hydrolase
LDKNLKIIRQSQILLGSTIVPYILKRSLRAKLIWLAVKPETGLTVTIPRVYNIALLEAYLQSKSNWILRVLVKMNNQQRLIETHCRSNTIYYLGASLSILKRTNNNKIAEIKIEQDQLIVNLDPCFRKQPSTEIEAWLKNQAVITINNKTRALSVTMGLDYNKLTIRNQKSRWASCSPRRNLSFNWRLIMTPEPVLDYVIIHELSHLREMNHSKKFWNIVSQYCPNWKAYRKWLLKHCGYLNSKIVLENY